MPDENYRDYNQQQPLIGSYMSPGLHPSTTALELTNTDIIQDFMHALKGERWDEVNSKYEQIGEELVNKTGRAKLMTVMLAVTNRNIILSDLDEDDIDLQSNAIGQAMITWLENNYEEWGIDESGLETIYQIIDVNIYAALRRSLGGQTLAQIAQMTKRIEGREGVKQDKPSFLDRLNPFK